MATLPKLGGSDGHLKKQFAWCAASRTAEEHSNNKVRHCVPQFGCCRPRKYFRLAEEKSAAELEAYPGHYLLQPASFKGFINFRVPGGPFGVHWPPESGVNLPICQRNSQPHFWAPSAVASPAKMKITQLDRSCFFTGGRIMPVAARQRPATRRAHLHVSAVAELDRVEVASRQQVRHACSRPGACFPAHS